MPIKVTCSNCGGVLHAPDDSAGKRGRCPSCGTVLTIPNESPASAHQGHSSAGIAAEPPRPVPQPPAVPKIPSPPPISEADLGARASAGMGGGFAAMPPEPRKAVAPPSAFGSKVPPDPRKYSPDPFSRASQTTSEPKGTSQISKAWKRTKSGLGWIQAALIFALLTAVGAAAVPVAQENGVNLPDGPAITKLEGFTQSLEIQAGVVIIPLTLSILCLVLGRMSVAAAPRESYGKGLAVWAAISALLVLIGFVVTIGITVVSLPNFKPNAVVGDAVNFQKQIQNMLNSVLLTSTEPAGVAQRFGATLLITFGVLSEMWFVAALGRFSAALQNPRASGRVNRFVIYMGILLGITVLAAVAYDIYGLGRIPGDPLGEWNKLDAKMRKMIVCGVGVFAGLVLMFMYWRMISGVKGAIREYLDSNPA